MSRPVLTAPAPGVPLFEQVQELERSNRELEQFAAVAAHELSEPLRMVTSYLQLLQHRYGGRLDDDADRFIHCAVDGAVRMGSLIDDLLTYSQVGGRGAGTGEAVDTGVLAARAVLTLTAGREGPAPVISVGELPVVSGDGQELGALFQNLLANALKFTPSGRGAEVEVTAEPCAAGWRFTVADRGIGLDAADAERIFGMFQRLHAADDYPGTGLGLAIARKVVERHGGRIWAQSRPGGGALLRFELPA